MKVVWQLEKATVRDVYETLRKRRQVAYTTVMTMMKILEDKGYLKKSRAERAYVYVPSRPRQQVVRAMVRDFVERVFDGATSGAAAAPRQGRPVDQGRARQDPPCDRRHGGVMDAILANLLGWSLQVTVVVAGAAGRRVDDARRCRAGAPCVVACRARRLSGAADPAAMACGDSHRRRASSTTAGRFTISIHRPAIPITAHRC